MMRANATGQPGSYSQIETEPGQGPCDEDLHGAEDLKTAADAACQKECNNDDCKVMCDNGDTPVCHGSKEECDKVKRRATPPGQDPDDYRIFGFFDLGTGRIFTCPDARTLEPPCYACNVAHEVMHHKYRTDEGDGAVNDAVAECFSQACRGCPFEQN